MISHKERSLIDACIGALEQSSPGFRIRDAQRVMIDAIAAALGNGGDEAGNATDGAQYVVVSAPTGVGKSAALILSGLPMAIARGKRLVISSSTLALQEQLMQKDLPLIARCVPLKFSYAVAKGRGRYACTAKLLDAAGKAAQEILDLEDAQAEQRADGAFVVELAESLTAGRWSGDRDDYQTAIPDGTWNALVTDRMACAGTKCSEFVRCPFYRQRDAVKSATVVVANHDLVLQALAMPPGTVLPDPSEMYLLFDEAHALPAKAMEQFASRHEVLGSVEWLDGLVDKIADVVAALRLDPALALATRENANALVNALRCLSHEVDASGALDEKQTRRFRNGVVAHWAQVSGQEILARGMGLADTLTITRELMLDQATSDQRLVQRLLAALGYFVSKLETLLGTWRLMLRVDSKARAPTARWIERYTTPQGDPDYMICASPLSGAEKLTELLWTRASAVVCTSATLTSCGSFDLFLTSTGLDRYRATQLVALDSPFDYARQARLVVPRMRSDPRDARAHTNEVVELLPKLITTRGTLVLFASAAQMREVARRLPAEIKADLICQGEMGRAQLIASHKARIDAGARSILFGLGALSEGVDLAGEYVTHVVISKLTFSVPVDPLEEARREWVESSGRSAFMEICVPEAGVRLAQSVGRLIRTESDVGTVTILDRRIATSRWGQALLRSLPPMPRDILRWHPEAAD